MEDSRYVSYLPNAYEPHIRYVQSSTNKIFPTEYHSLLTTIVDLQRNYIERLSPEYQDECSNDNKHEFNNYNSPLDLSVKSSVDITPPQSPQSFSIKRHNLEMDERSAKRFKENHYDTPLDFTKIKHEQTSTEHTIKEHCLNISSNYNILEKTPTKSATAKVNTAASKKLNREHSRTAVTKKVARKLQFDEETRSPVSGTIIRELGDDEHLVVRKGDIDPAFNVVEVTDEAKAELAKIDNVIGDYLCRLCKELYEDAFTLAQHRCSRIMLIEYRCPECEKVFNCPANLASHRRWHKPRDQHKTEHKLCEGQEKEEPFPCVRCGKTFRKQAYLRKHLNSHHKENVPSKQEEDAAVILTSLKLSGNDFRNLAV